MRRVAVVVAVAVVLGGCGATTAAPTTSATPASSTTITAVAVSTTVKATSSSTIAVSVTTDSTVPDWTPPCVAYSGGPIPAAGPYRDAALDRFAPLASRPTLTVALPNGAPIMTNMPDEPPYVEPVRVEGGVLLALSASDTSASRTSILAVVNTDGTKRWVRCIAGRIAHVWVAAPSTQPKTATIAVLTGQSATTFASEWPVVSLADGTTQGSLSDAAVKAGISASDFAHYTVYPTDPPPSPSSGLISDATVDDYRAVNQLLHYDATTGTLTAVPVPAEFKNSNDAALGLDTAGEPIVSDTYAVGGYERVLTVYKPAGWSHDPAVLRQTFGLRPFLGAGTGDSPLVGVDATGTIAWTAAQLVSPQRQDMSVSTDGLTAVATVCTNGTVDQCVPALVGLDNTTGKRLWTLPGWRHVSALADGYLLASDSDLTSIDATAVGPGWSLFNARTGKIVSASQHWTDPNEFTIGCCGDSGLIDVYHLGGMVIAIHYRQLRVWLPLTIAGTPHTITIP
jgi:hypothetical protein